MRQLVAGLSGPPPLPAAVVDRIVESAAGIPLFAEEVGRAVLESGILVADGTSWKLTSALTNLSVPQTLQGSLPGPVGPTGPGQGSGATCGHHRA